MPAVIDVQQSHLQVREGATLALISGNIAIQGGGAAGANLSAPSGRMALLSVTSPGEVSRHFLSVSPGRHGTPVGLGSITLTNAAHLDVSGSRGGLVVIRGGRLHVEQASVISAHTTGAQVHARTGIDIAVRQQVELSGGAQIRSNTGRHGGHGGTIRIQAGQVSLTEGAQISSDTNSRDGRGGSVEIVADTVVIAGHGRDQRPSRLSTSTAGSQAAGMVRIVAARVHITDGGLIFTSTTSTAAGGTVAIQAANGQIVLSRGGQILSETFATSPTGGPGGTIRLTARSLVLRDEARIFAQSAGSGDAGSISLTAAQTLQTTNSTIATAAMQAQGGTIRIRAPRVHLRHSDITTTVTAGNERAGNVNINAGVIVLQDESHLRANAQGGPGGNIRLLADVFLADPSSAVTASSQRNVAGEIDIRAPVTNLSGVIDPLPQDPLHAEDVVYDQCAAQRQEGRPSRLVIRERDGAPETPTSGLASRLYVPPARRDAGSTLPQYSGKPHAMSRPQRRAERSCGTTAF